MSHQRTEWASYLTQPFHGDDWQVRAMKMTRAVRDNILNWLVDMDLDNLELWAAVETPDNWFNDRGMDSKNAGDIQKLYWFVGVLASQLQSCRVDQIWTAVPKAWKGQTPKPIMVKRAMTQLERSGIKMESAIPHDAGEAVLLARIAGEKFRTKVQEGKGWVRIWSREDLGDQIKVKTWSR